MSQAQIRLPYTTPQLREHGDIRALTRHHHSSKDWSEDDKYQDGLS